MTTTHRGMLARFPEWSARRAALQESGDGFCALCDHPIRLKPNGKRVSRYHCGKPACKRQWYLLADQDAQKAARLARSASP